MSRASNEEVANAIKDFLIEKNIAWDVCIFYDNKRIRFEDGVPTLEEGYKASSFFKYANDDWVCMTFEGSFYYIMNDPHGVDQFEIAEEFEEMLDLLGYYPELGNAWNLNVVPMDN